MAVAYIERYTYEDYKHWEGRWELIEGMPYAMAPMPIIRHQKVSNKIAKQLDELLKNCHKCFATLPVDWKIDENTVVQPDNLVICYDVDDDAAFITKAPSVIFEVLSPSTALKDETIKFDLYEREGVKYYVLVNTEDKIAKVYENKNGRFVKKADATQEKVKFEFECEFEFDFNKIWV
ncbi:Uma2 family endonuclease [Caminibacter sp.]